MAARFTDTILTNVTSLRGQQEHREQQQQNNEYYYIPTVTIMTDGNFKPLFRHCLRNLSPPKKNPTACDHVARWDTSRVTNCGSLFFEQHQPTYNNNNNNNDSPREEKEKHDWNIIEGAQYFNVDISNWNLRSCTTMRSMFHGASSFNQPLGGGGGGGRGWQTTKVTDMSHMFHGAEAFDQDLRMFQTHSVTDMSHMFQDASQFSGKGLSSSSSPWSSSSSSSWDVSRVTSFQSMFQNARSFNEFIGRWDVSKASNFQSMFDGAHTFNQDISGWHLKSATNLRYMFRHASEFNQDLSTWERNMNSVEDFTGMFQFASSFQQTLCWDLKTKKENNNTGTDDIGNMLMDHFLEGTKNAKIDTNCSRPLQLPSTTHHHQHHHDNNQHMEYDMIWIIVVSLFGCPVVLMCLILLMRLILVMIKQFHFLHHSRSSRKNKKRKNKNKKPTNLLGMEEEEILFSDATTHGKVDYFDDETGEITFLDDDDGNNNNNNNNNNSAERSDDKGRQQKDLDLFPLSDHSMTWSSDDSSLERTPLETAAAVTTTTKRTIRTMQQRMNDYWLETAASELGAIVAHKPTSKTTTTCLQEEEEVEGPCPFAKKDYLGLISDCEEEEIDFEEGTWC